MSARRQFATLKIIYFIFFEVGPLVSRGRVNLIEIMVAENHIEKRRPKLGNCSANVGITKKTI